MSASSASKAGQTVKASSPKKPAAQQSGSRKTPAQQGGKGGKGLVRPAPRAKVRRARLVVSKVDTWSVLKLAFLLSVALGIITVVASLVLWIVLNLTGLFDGINEMLSMLGGNAGGTDIKRFLSLGNVALFATVISVANVILLSVLSVLASLLYNIAASLIGGIGVTLTDD
ncbi:DUF3566 domain-containing protein [Kocuria salsicia]|uniref:DUF3566 domain-containing protein n=1 Tax=Kocuria salsicia TaxID=664639 RepID=A0ABV3KER8_9MICC|nr:DUF3566 domain-containing protein [uncultured Kocuria sp.]